MSKTIRDIYGETLAALGADHPSLVVLDADVYRPMGPEKVPAILCTGYGGKRDTNNKSDNIRTNEGKPMHWNRPVSGLQAWEGLDPAEWVPYGYAVVNVDPTGVCASEGNMLFFDEEDRRNGRDIIEAVAAMDWCSGKVALAGSSWLAMVQFSYAAAQPPHLTCIAPFESEGDPYRDEYVRGGIPLQEQSFSLSYRTHGQNYMDNLGANSRLHPLYDDHYMGELKQFFDHYLKGLDNGWEKTPRVRVGLLDPGGVNIDDQPEDSYPSARMKPTRFYIWTRPPRPCAPSRCRRRPAPAMTGVPDSASPSASPSTGSWRSSARPGSASGYRRRGATIWTCLSATPSWTGTGIRCAPTWGWAITRARTEGSGYLTGSWTRSSPASCALSTPMPGGCPCPPGKLCRWISRFGRPA